MILLRYYKRYTDIREADGMLSWWVVTKSGGATSIKKIENVFFDFAWDWENVRRIAYAPSFGPIIWDIQMLN
ncbi:MAG: hypothetical protein ACLUVG_21215 [Phocaeicola vulgatus]